MQPATGRLPEIVSRPKGADLTREKLLQATHELLLEHPGIEPPVSQICERADVQTAMVSYCFGSKAQLLDALLERTSSVLRNELEHCLALDVPPNEKLRLNIRAMVENFFRYPYVVQVTQRLHGDDRTEVRAATTFAEPMLAFYRQLLADGSAAHGWAEVDPIFFYMSLVGMCEFFFAGQRWLEDTSGLTLDDELLERFTDHTVRLVMRGLAGG